MTRAEARMVAQELFKLIRPLVADELRRIVAEATDKMLSSKQAAEYIGWSRQTLYNRIKDVPHLKCGRTLRFSRAALDEFMRRR